ncbi:helix-hairpin-helix domain-containing protein [Lentilactobacillus sp. Marseille-Q4993]|uniref:helix-hairpin-helix domain-containing protein n=1 Tax=Lentilactobacillus sp. Marseille-Q4993 TaxID=3039492 RepID=UPI0024BBF7F9|nr:helix-hairpin-helix domain-containing protein [Lentilactobacillus sp. Marseille-Q4993]
MNRIKEIIDEYTYYVVGGMFGIIILIGFAWVMVGSQVGNNKQPVRNNTLMTKAASQESLSNKESESSQTTPANVNSGSAYNQIYVDVKGAVKNPGVFQVTSRMRVNDAINLAGGFNRSADRKQVNLAQRLTDQQVVYIPIKGEIKGNSLASGTTPQEPANQTQMDSSTGDSGQTGDSQAKINLNTADKTKLQELNGIGEKKADQIIGYRKSHGQFKKIEEIKDVPGFGDKTFDNLKSLICV